MESKKNGWGGTRQPSEKGRNITQLLSCNLLKVEIMVTFLLKVENVAYCRVADCRG